MIDPLLVVLSALLGASVALLAPSPLMIAAAVSSVGMLAAALLVRRTGLLVASGALLSLCALSAYLSFSGERLWHALAFGVGLLVLVDAGWDRVRLVPARITARTYGARLRSLARVAGLSAASVFVAVTLGHGTALRFRIAPTWAVAVGVAALAGAGVAALILAEIGRRNRAE